MLQAINVMNTDGLLWTCSCQTLTQTYQQGLNSPRGETPQRYRNPSKNQNQNLLYMCARGISLIAFNPIQASHLGNLPDNSQDEVGSPSPLQERKKWRGRHQSWTKTAPVWVSSHNHNINHEGGQQFISPMAAWTVSRIAHVCRKPWEQQQKENNSEFQRRLERTETKGGDRGGGREGGWVQMRSPATAYAEWTGKGGERQGRRRRRATNLNSVDKKKH